MSEAPLGTPEKPVKVSYDIPVPVSDELRYEDVATGKLRVIEDDLGNRFTYDEFGYKVPVMVYGSSKTTRGEGFISYEGIPSIGVPSDEVEGEYDLRVDMGNGQVEEWDKLTEGESFSSLIQRAFTDLGYNDAMISWVKSNYSNFTFKDEETLDLPAILSAYNQFMFKNPTYEDRFFVQERRGGEPREDIYGLDWRVMRDAVYSGITDANKKAEAADVALVEQAKLQTKYLEKIAAEQAKEDEYAGENVVQYIQRILEQGAPTSGTKSIEDFMSRVLPKLNLVGQTAMAASNLVQNYQRSSDLQTRANQAYLAGDVNAYDRLDLQAFRMENRMESNFRNLMTGMERYTPELAAKSYLSLIKEPALYVKKAGKVPKYKTYKTSAFEVPKVTSKAIADKQSAKIKALEAKIADLTAKFKKLKGVP